MIYFAAYLVLLTLFLIANKRWGDRMARMDADMAEAFEEDCAARGK